jgi:hypothetical protein
MMLGARAAQLAAAADAAEAAVERSREILAGRAPPSGATNLRELQDQIKAVRTGFDSQHAAAKQARTAADGAQRVASSCKAWLASLPQTDRLRSVTPAADGSQDLPAVRARLAAVQQELRELEATPLPAPDLRECVAQYVRTLARHARPVVRNVDKPTGLSVLWPGEAASSRLNLSGFADYTGNALLFAAALFPDQLTDYIVATADAEANRPLPVAQRPARMAALAAERETLWRVIAALVEREVANGNADATHAPETPPWAVLGVVAESGERSQPSPAATPSDAAATEDAPLPQPAAAAGSVPAPKEEPALSRSEAATALVREVAAASAQREAAVSSPPPAASPPNAETTSVPPG